jgi:hypothetical protein
MRRDHNSSLGALLKTDTDGSHERESISVQRVSNRRVKQSLAHTACADEAFRIVDDRPHRPAVTAVLADRLVIGAVWKNNGQCWCRQPSIPHGLGHDRAPIQSRAVDKTIRVLGSSPSLLHQSLTAPQRFPGAAPNNPVLALSTGSTLVSGFLALASTDVTAVLSLPPKITFPGKQRPT